MTGVQNQARQLNRTKAHTLHIRKFAHLSDNPEKRVTTMHQENDIAEDGPTSSYVLG